MLMSKVFDSTPLLNTFKNRRINVPINKLTNNREEESEIEQQEEKEKANLMIQWQRIHNSKMRINYSSFSFELRKKHNELVELMNKTHATNGKENNDNGNNDENAKSYQEIHASKGFQYKNIYINNNNNNENNSQNNNIDSIETNNNNNNKMKFEEKLKAKFENLLLFTLNETNMTWN